MSTNTEIEPIVP
jgi:hypothetical protein